MLDCEWAGGDGGAGFEEAVEGLGEAGGEEDTAGLWCGEGKEVSGGFFGWEGRNFLAVGRGDKGVGGKVRREGWCE